MESRILYHEVMPLEGKKKKNKKQVTPLSRRGYMHRWLEERKAVF